MTVKGRTPKEEPQHTDLLGNQLAVGDIVVAVKSNSLALCKVEKLNPKRVRCAPVNGKYYFQAWPKDVAKIREEDATIAILGMSK